MLRFNHTDPSLAASHHYILANANNSTASKVYGDKIIVKYGYLDEKSIEESTWVEDDAETSTESGAYRALKLAISTTILALTLSFAS